MKTSKLDTRLIKLAKANKVNGYGSTGRLFVCSVGEETWWTESHFALRADSKGRGDVLRSVFGRFNLELEPGTYEVNGSIARVPQGPPRFETILNDIKARPYAAVERTVIAGKTGFFSSTDHWYALFDLPEGHIAADWEYVSFAQDSARVTQWQAVDALKPLAGYDNDGELVAVVMPFKL